MKPFESAIPIEWKATLETENGIIIDVRTEGEFEDSYIIGARNIEFHEHDFENQIRTINKETGYFLYCRTGERAFKAMGIMQTKGFKKVFNLEGGIAKWELDGFDVEYGDDF